MSGFNEASALQRRKLVVLLGQGFLFLASMRPPLFSGGNPRFEDMEFTLWRCFNEASALQRRKPEVPRRLGTDRGRASMRPPLFSGGNGGMKILSQWDIVRFNEASALQRRKLVVLLGQGFLFLASMRPPLFSGGNGG